MCFSGIVYEGCSLVAHASEQGFDMKLLQKLEAQCRISFGFIQLSWDYFCMFFGQVNNYVQ